MPMKRLSVAIASLLALACDIPTEAPKWDSTFVVQTEGTSLSVGQVLPSGVTLTNGNTAFLLSLSPAFFSSNLGFLCSGCQAFNGQFAPKPAFNSSFNTAIALPADVASATLSSGSVNVSITNGFSFDPLRPSATARGSLTITIRSGGVTVGTATVSGTTTSFGPGTTLNIAVPLTAGTVSGTLDVTVTVDSPAGDPAQINTSAVVSATATPSGIVITSAQVRVNGRVVNAVQTQLKLGNIDTFVSDHVKSGALLFTINNPFGITGNLTLTLTGGTRPVIKTVALGAGTTNVEVPFDQSDLQAILGHDVNMAISGTVTAASPITVTPTQTLSVTSKLKLIVTTGT